MAWGQTPPGWGTLPCRVWGLGGACEGIGVALGRRLKGTLEGIGSLGVTRKDWGTAGMGPMCLEVAFTGVGQLEEKVAFGEVWGGSDDIPHHSRAPGP